MRKYFICATLLLVVLMSAAYYTWNHKLFFHQKILKNVSTANQAVADKVVSIEDFVNKSIHEVEQPQSNQVSKAVLASDITNPQINVEVPTCVLERVSNFDCYEAYYRTLVEKNGIGAAFTDLRNRYDHNDYVKSQCHPVTHIIGQAAVAKFASVAEAYKHGDSFCWSGYYHGVLEGVMGKLGREATLQQLDNICAEVPGKEQYNFDYYNCVHGLGHGLMAINNDELFITLDLCDKLTGSFERSSCYSGAFMENIIIDNKNHFTKYLKPEEPLYPCSAVGDKYKQTCYLMQTSYMLKVTGRDFIKVFGLCNQVEQEFRPTCFQSLGRDASSQTVSTPVGTKALCDLGLNFEAKSNCIIGAVKDFISYFHSDTQARGLCNILSADLQPTCLSTTESYYKVF